MSRKGRFDGEPGDLLWVMLTPAEREDPEGELIEIVQRMTDLRWPNRKTHTGYMSGWNDALGEFETTPLYSVRDDRTQRFRGCARAYDDPGPFWPHTKSRIRNGRPEMSVPDGETATQAQLLAYTKQRQANVDRVAACIEASVRKLRHRDAADHAAIMEALVTNYALLQATERVFLPDRPPIPYPYGAVPDRFIAWMPRMMVMLDAWEGGDARFAPKKRKGRYAP